jgi:hypothetical protein
MGRLAHTCRHGFERGRPWRRAGFPIALRGFRRAVAARHAEAERRQARRLQPRIGQACTAPLALWWPGLRACRAIAERRWTTFSVEPSLDSHVDNPSRAVNGDSWKRGNKLSTDVFGSSAFGLVIRPNFCLCSNPRSRFIKRFCASDLAIGIGGDDAVRGLPAAGGGAVAHG